MASRRRTWQPGRLCHAACGSMIQVQLRGLEHAGEHAETLIAQWVVGWLPHAAAQHTATPPALRATCSPDGGPQLSTAVHMCHHSCFCWRGLHHSNQLRRVHCCTSAHPAAPRHAADQFLDPALLSAQVTAPPPRRSPGGSAPRADAVAPDALLHLARQRQRHVPRVRARVQRQQVPRAHREGQRRGRGRREHAQRAPRRRRGARAACGRGGWTSGCMQRLPQGRCTADRWEFCALVWGF